MEKRSYKFDRERRAEIVETARNLFEEKGLAKTSMSDIAKKTGVSRGTVYYYFEDKGALIDAVLDTYIEDLAETLEIWEETRVKGNNYEALRSSILLIKRLVFEKTPLRRNLAENENAGFYARFSARAINRLVSKLDETTIKYYAEHYQIEIDHLPETFYVLIAGLTSYIRANPDADIDKLTEVAAQTLRIPLKAQLEK